MTWIARAAAIVALVGGIGWALRPRPIIVETAQAAFGGLEATVTAEGRTRVKDLFVVAAPVDGELERIAVRAGETVSPTTVIARIRPGAPRPLDARSRAEALAAVSAARAAIDQAEAVEQEALGALAHAESQRATASTLSSAGAVPSKDFEHAVHEVEIRRQAVEASRAALGGARADLARAEAAAAVSTVPAGRTVTDVRSPTSGRVLSVLRESAGPVAAGTPLVHVGNVSAIEIVADFLTTDAMTVTAGAKAIIRNWGGPANLAARVRQIDPGGFTKVSALGLEEQRVPIVLDLVREPPAAFGNDFHVNVSIVVWTRQHVLTVPMTALFRMGERWAVFAVQDGRAQLRRITVGRSDGERIVVEEGLDAGDDVVVQPSDALRDGSRVRPLANPRH
jgi:HlyD family secretion protein